MKPRDFFWIAVMLVLLFVRAKPQPPTTTTVTDTVIVAPEGLQKALRELQIEHAGVLNSLRGRERVQPIRIIRPSTELVVEIPDTVSLAIQSDLFSGVTVGVGVVSDPSTGAVSPEIHEFPPCERWSWVGGEFVCDSPRLGHLGLIAGLAGSIDTQSVWGYEAWLGLEWIPSMVSPWTVGLVATSEGRVLLGLQRGFSIF